MLNLNKHTTTKRQPTLIFNNYSHDLCALYTTVVHNHGRESSR